MGNAIEIPDRPGIGRISLRRSTPADFEFCYRLNELNFRSFVVGARGWDDESERTSMAEQFHPGVDWIIQLDGQDVGHLGVEETEGHVELRMLVLMPEVQGIGVGTSIVTWVIESAREHAKPVSLWVTARNDQAVKCYERLGFRVVGSSHDASKQVRKLRMAY